MSDAITSIEGREVKLTNLHKVMWPGEELTKAHLIRYYHEIAPVLLPHIRNRLLVMKRYPDGIQGEAFYQKECPAYAPDWVETYAVSHSRKVINYIVCNDTATLVWLANQGCIEVHCWTSRLGAVDHPDLAVMDLDPSEGVPFEVVLKVARLFRRALEEFGLKGYPKTSGASGLHIFIPILPIYTYPVVTATMKFLAELVMQTYPDGATVERSIPKRRGKVYLDYLQNGRGKTMAFQYGLRPVPGAPVSAPLNWAEVESQEVDPHNYNLKTIFKRIQKHGDLYADLIYNGQSLQSLLDIAPIEADVKHNSQTALHLTSP